MPLELDAALVAEVAYRALAQARKGARCAVYGPGEHLQDLVMDYKSLSEDEQDYWQMLVSRVLASVKQYDGLPYHNLVEVTKGFWSEITQTDGARLFTGPNEVGLSAFIRASVVFLDPENDEDDIRDIVQDEYDWFTWGKKRQEKMEEHRV